MVAPTMATTSTEPELIVLRNQSYSDFRAAVEENPLYTVEYIDSTVYMTPAPTPRHQLVLGNLLVSLHRYVKSRGLGMVLMYPLEIELAPQRCIVQADILYIVRSRIAALLGEERITGAPDFVVQILSPMTERMDRVLKLSEYARAGIQEYWIVEPEKRVVSVHVLEGDAYQVAGLFLAGQVVRVGMFAGAEIEVDAIFDG